MDRITDTHVFFWGSVFSNWAEAKFEYKGHEFNNTEQAFMWEKAMFFDDKKIAQKILENENPKDCKDLGRKVKHFDQESWMINCFTFMVAVNYAKYTQHPELKETLLSTGDKVIVEASPHDKIWGIGLHWNDDRCLDESNWEGMNLLGKALMHVRETLKFENNE